MDLADMIKFKILRWGDHPRLYRWDLMQLNVSLKEMAEGNSTEEEAIWPSHGLHTDMAMATAKESVTRRSCEKQWINSSLSLWRETVKLIPWFQLRDTSFRLWASRTSREQISVVLRQQVCVNLPKQLQETDRVSYYPSSTVRNSGAVHTNKSLCLWQPRLPERLRQYFKAKQRHKHPKIQRNLKWFQY